MRCHQARRRIDEIGLTDFTDAETQELLEHLQTCPGCARKAQASQELQRALARSRVHDTEGGLSWEHVRAGVEARAALAHPHQSAERPVMAILKNSFSRRPKLSFGICAAIAVVLAVTLIPFKYNRDMGFEVAVAGVNKDVALNSEGISQFMAQLGLHDAVVDVTGCDVTCNLKITQLKSPEDARLVAAAFEEMGKNKVFVSVGQACEEASGNLLKFVEAHVSQTDLKAIQEDKEKMHQILVERLGVGYESNVMFFAGKCGDSATFDIALCDSALAGCKSLTWVDAGSADHAHELKAMQSMMEAQFDVQGSGQLINEDGSVNEEALQSLKDKGFGVDIVENPDGTKSVNIYKAGAVDDAEFGDAAKSSDNAELPESFSLSQNYPNPFNPTTRIDYSLPSAQHVTLEIYNVHGQKVRTLVDAEMGPGDHTVEWDATSDAGTQVASGVYLYRLTAGDQTETKKMSFVK